MTYYEKGEHVLKEKHLASGYSRETFDEERWQKGVGQPRDHPYSRVVDDYRRTDYAYRPNDGFVVRRPGSLHNIREPVYSAKNGSRSEFNSPVSQTGVSRAGSPGPVAGAGDILNTEHGFTIQLDVKHFRANEIKVVLNDDLLCVTGERIEECGDGQTLRRSFSRKYSIPADIKLESIRSHLTDHGVLVVSGSRRGWKETNISYHDAPRPASSIISTV